MPADSVYSDDIRLLDDLTRLKLKVIQKKLNSNSHRDHDVITPTKYRQHHRRYVPTPTDSERSLTPPPVRKREKFYRKMDRRNELLHKLWEELGDGGRHHRRSHHERYLPPLTPRRDAGNPPIFAFNEGFKGTGNTKKDLMELMLIQNAQLQQWMMAQTLARRANSASEDGPHHYHHYYGPNGALPPIKKTDSGAQYPQDFFESRAQSPAATGTAQGGKSNKRR